ncbi:hypothetical protein [Sphingobacterium deserti]|uniref:Glycosyltransferase n=1 Tax=Sphingobacterium deserti TaxID=1229276 RepID=A0A0B8T0B0_9SPHI|nr:hypothetical protein [Sphingobacterium deserti]KGE13917.1 hypothetical protein DI53_2329 [Sphingobacterium deserti]
MKICIISFDYWNYDCHIVSKLREHAVEASHINMGAYKYRNFRERAFNACSKLLRGKNIKHVKRQEYVLESLAGLGHQDQILILNPHTLDRQTILAIKKFTNRLITYLYDNLDRFPVEGKLNLFDKIYSFEDRDVAAHGFEKITNYNYLNECPEPSQGATSDLFYITSYDRRRNKIVRKLAGRLASLDLKSKMVVVGKQIWKEKLRSMLFRPQHSCIELKNKPVYIDTVLEEYKNSKVIVDLMREGQEGLSFRIFEAMALEKKIITDNPRIKDYDFYDPQNILCINNDLSEIDNTFFETPYRPLADKIYKKYTLDYWVSQVFNLSNQQAKIALSTVH